MNDSASSPLPATALSTTSDETLSFRSLARTEQRRQLIVLIEQGRSDEEIGHLVDMSQWQVRNLRYRLGIKKDRGGNVYLENSERAGGSELTLLPSTSSSTSATSPCHFSLHGKFTTEQLTQRLAGLRALIENGEAHREYQVLIEFMETNLNHNP